MEILEYWPPDDDVRECMPTQADDAPDSLFLALHQPMSIRKVPIGGGGHHSTESETDFLVYFIQDNPDSGALVVPVVGESGSGKSHLIRWLNIRLENLQDSDRRHVIWIPKNHNLRGVLQLILDELPGSKYDEVRDRLNNARDRMNERSLAIQLRANLLIQLADRNEELNSQVKSKQQQGEQPPREMMLRHSLTDRSAGLPALLDDNVTQSRFLGEEGVLTRIVDGIIRDGVQEDDARLPQFESKDLDFNTTDIDLSKASHAARNAVSYICGNPEIKEAALTLLNELIDPAINQLADLGDCTLRDILLAIRENLLQDGKELILLIEDFVRMAGIQGDLLEAMIEPAEIHGVRKYCTMRTALAVTSGMMVDRQTVATRAGYEWVLEDCPASLDGGISTQDYVETQIVNLAGGYLNAARLGRQQLEEKYVAGVDEWPPQFSPSADRPRSVVEAFGSSDANYALFPFNRKALLQLFRERYSGTNDELILRPRYVINLIREVLIQNRHLVVDGRFPPSGWYDHDRLVAEIEVLVRQSTTESDVGERTVTFLHYWGGHPETVQEVYTISPDLFKSFSLPTFTERQPIIEVEPTPAPRKSVGSPGAAPPSVPPEDTTTAADGKKIRDWKKILEKWRGGTQIPANKATTLRNWARDALFAYMDFSSEQIRVDTGPSAKKYYGKWVHLPNASGGFPEANDSRCLLAVCSDTEYDDENQRLEMELSLMSLIKRQVCGTFDGVEPDEWCRYATLMDRWTPQALKFLKGNPFGEKEDKQRTVTSIVKRLLCGSQVLGARGAFASDVTQNIAAIFGTEEQPGNYGPEGWEAVQKAFYTTREDDRDALLRQVGARQGTGDEIKAIDVTRLFLPIKEARKLLNAGLTGAKPPPCEGCTTAQVRSAITSVWSDMRKWKEEVSDFLGDADWRECLDLVRETVKKAQKLQVARGQIQARTLLEHLDNLPQGIGGLQEVCGSTGDDITLTKALKGISDFDHDVAKSVQAFIHDAQNLCAETRKHMTRNTGVVNDEDATSLQNDVREALESLDDSIAKLGDH